MNSFKLLPCGRIIFFNSRLAARGAASDSLSEIGGSGVSSQSDSTNDCQESNGCYLGSSHAAISDNPSKNAHRARRGSQGITSHGRNTIRAGCHWLEEMFGKRNLTFLTATLPDQAMRACTPATWALVVNRFLKSLRYHLKGEGLCQEIVGCTEIQEKRLLTTDGIPPLHLHLLFQGRKPYQQWGIDKAEYQRLWSQACKSVWSLSVEFGQSCRSESVRSSGVSYMSKYLSKGGAVLSKCNPELLPSAWFTASANLKEMIKRTVLRCSNYLAFALFEQIQESNILKWARDIWSVEHGDGSQYLVAWVGQIASRDVYWSLKSQIESFMGERQPGKNKSAKFVF